MLFPFEEEDLQNPEFCESSLIELEKDYLNNEQNTPEFNEENKSNLDSHEANPNQIFSETNQISLSKVSFTAKYVCIRFYTILFWNSIEN